ncbi:hypothetical protein [Streptomyces sp. NPDC016845]|uniref:hypothetical protein n=1 Tax=Streptomyces sp. NPDC016845 TaxID=3364972 RepID=UPI0037AC06FE
MLGVVAGVCTGYIVQADRAVDRLPALSQPTIEQAKGAPQPLSAAQDRAVRTEGDLRRLLVRAPKGARDVSGGTGDGAWMDVADIAATYEDTESAFSHLLESEFRRAASVMWTEDGTDIEVRLTQYRDLESTDAQASAIEQQQGMDWRFPDDTPDGIPGSGTGTVYVGADRDPESGWYQAEAVASRGDLEMEIWLSNADRPVSKKRAMELARAQWGRM